MTQRKRILVVDDESCNRLLLQSALKTLGYEPEHAQDGFEALAKLSLDIDVVLLDVMMPGMDGFEVARRIKKDIHWGDTPIIMVTSLTSREDRLRAVEAGAGDYISKPVDLVELRVRLASILRMKEAQDALKHHKAELEATVRRRTAALRKSLEDIGKAQRRTHQAHMDTIRRLVLASEFKDDDTGAHVQRVSSFSALIAEALKLPPGEVEIIREAAPMHDVGKIGIPDAVLQKPGQLTAEEMTMMHGHCEIGAQILGGSRSQILQAGEIIALSHHERWDGAGYPYGQAGEDIPLFGRICALADVFDALTNKRSYKEPYPLEKAVGILKEDRGRHFDPTLVDIFMENLGQVVEIQDRCCG